MGIALSKPKAPVVLFLVGKTGHGKSSTGNTIIGKNVFCTSSSVTSVTTKIEVAWAARDQIIKVVDGPGLCGTADTAGSTVEEAVQNFEKGVAECLGGINALVIVYKFGVRFTQEEKDSVDTLKIMFGKDFVKKHCVLLITHGEQLHLAHQDLTFEDWCSDQTGPFKELINECQNRVVLFYNLSNDKKEECVRKLFQKVKEIGNVYTNTQFEKEREEREKFIVKCNGLQLREEVKMGIDIMIDDLRQIAEIPDDKSKIKTMAFLMARVADFEKKLSAKEKGTQIFQDMKRVLGVLQKDIHFNMKFCQDNLNIIRDQVHYDTPRIFLCVFTLDFSEVVRAIKATRSHTRAQNYENLGLIN